MEYFFSSKYYSDLLKNTNDTETKEFSFGSNYWPDENVVLKVDYQNQSAPVHKVGGALVGLGGRAGETVLWLVGWVLGCLRRRLLGVWRGPRRGAVGRGCGGLGVVLLRSPSPRSALSTAAA